MNCTMTVSAGMEITTAKVVPALARVWGEVPSRHGNVTNLYVKVDKEEGIEIVLHVPQGMELAENELKILGTSNKIMVALELRKILYGMKQTGWL